MLQLKTMEKRTLTCLKQNPHHFPYHDVREVDDPIYILKINDKQC